jgi:hypothetical protein
MTMAKFQLLPSIDIQVRRRRQGTFFAMQPLIPPTPSSLNFQYDTLAVFDDVAQAVVEQEDFWVSCVSRMIRPSLAKTVS